MVTLHVTMCRVLGIPPDQSFVGEKRTVCVPRDGKGVPIFDLFA